jgi:antitoxin component of MazEF toxin-antitoxin module
MATTLEQPDPMTLTRVGDRLALVLDDALLARLGFTAETRLQVRIDGRSLHVSPQPAAAGQLTDEAFGTAVNEVLKRYDQTFRELAN